MPKKKTRRKPRPQNPGPRIDQGLVLLELGQEVESRGLLVGAIDKDGNQVRWEDPKLVNVCFLSAVQLGDEPVRYTLEAMLEPIIARHAPVADVKVKARATRAIQTEIIANGRRYAMKERDGGWGNVPEVARA